MLERHSKPVLIDHSPHEKLSISTPALKNLVSELLEIYELITGVVKLVHFGQSVIVFDVLRFFQLFLKPGRFHGFSSTVLQVVVQLSYIFRVLEGDLGLIGHNLFDVLQRDVRISVGSLVLQEKVPQHVFYFQVFGHIAFTGCNV